jgi:hypothetical protein
MFFLSVGVKFATGLLLPFFFWITLFQRQKGKISWSEMWSFSFTAMMLAILAAMVRLEFQPWYLLYSLPFVALRPERKSIFWVMTSLSGGLLLHYALFFSRGNWDSPVPALKGVLIVVSLLVGQLIAAMVTKQPKAKDVLKLGQDHEKTSQV